MDCMFCGKLFNSIYMEGLIMCFGCFDKFIIRNENMFNISNYVYLLGD